MLRSTHWTILAGSVLTASLALGQGGFDGPGSYEIRNLKSGQVLDLDPGDRVTLVQFPPRGTPSQQWLITNAAPGYFYLRNAATGRALELTQDRNSAPVLCQTNQPNPNQHWRIEAGKDGNAMLISRFGKALDVPDGASRDGQRLQVYDRNGDSNQRFVLRRVAGIIGSLPEVRGRDDRGDDRSRPDRNGRYFDDRERMWKLAGDGVCFYREPGFRGDALCVRAGDDLADVNREAGGGFRSLKIFGSVRNLTIYERPGFQGGAYRMTRDEPDLGRVRSDWTDSVGSRMGSLRVN